MDSQTKPSYEELARDGYEGIVVFTAQNCGPCARLKPLVESICDEYTVPRVYVDIQENLPAARALCLRGSPSVVHLDGFGVGRLVHTGDASDAILRAKLAAAEVI